MPADILSLSKARKAKARAGKEQQAAENRILFGRTKAEKQLQKAQDERADKTLDGMRLSSTSSDGNILTKK
jgi:hypothetical protein